MKSSDTIDKLAADYIAAQIELKNATFDKVNPHFKSRYATLAQVRDTVTPVLAKHGLGIIQGSQMLDGAAVITTRLVHKSGQWIESAYPFTIGKPQEMGSAMTYARRYGLSAICNIASEEDDDGNEGQKLEGAIIAPMPVVHRNTKTASREEFQRLCADMNRITRLKDLDQWAADEAKAIGALEPELQENLRNSFVEKKNELKGTLAA